MDSHRDGNAQTPGDVNTQYGVRLDDPVTSDTQTFRFNEFSANPAVLGASTVSAILDTDTGIMTIMGTIFHIQDSDSRYGLQATIQFLPGQLTAMTIADLQLNMITGQLEANTTSLTLADLDGGGFSPLNWIGHPKDPGDPEDILFGNNHRGNPGISGWGWLEPANPHYTRTPAQDWLFEMTYVPTPPPPPLVPEPATLGLFGIGLAGLVLRRGRKNV